jgi:muconolactone delta-isomerase
VNRDADEAEETRAIEALTERLQALTREVVHDLWQRGGEFTAADVFEASVQRLGRLSAADERLVRTLRTALLAHPDGLMTSARRGSGDN